MMINPPSQNNILQQNNNDTSIRSAIQHLNLNTNIPEEMPTTSTTNVTERIIKNISQITEQKKQEIIKAVTSNNEVKVDKFLNEFSIDELAKLRFENITPNNVNYKNTNLFFLACRSGCLKVVQKLISNKHIDINEAFCGTHDGDAGVCFFYTPLMIASQCHLDIVRLLLENNADITKKTNKDINAELYSLITLSSKGVERCFEMQKVFHEYRKEQGLPLGELNGLQYKCIVNRDFSAQISFFNGNKDFILFLFEYDENDKIVNITHKSTHVVVEKIFDKFKYFAMPEQQCNTKEIINYFNKASQVAPVTVVFPEDVSTDNNMNLIDILMSQFPVLYANDPILKDKIDNLGEKNLRSRMTKAVHVWLTDALFTHYNLIKDDLKKENIKDYSLEKFPDLDSLRWLSVADQDQVIDAVSYFICTRSQLFPITICEELGSSADTNIVLRLVYTLSNLFSASWEYSFGRLK